MDKYRGYNITYYRPPVPSRIHDFQYSHEDYDGPPDNRCGSAASFEEVKEKIDLIIEEEEYKTPGEIMKEITRRMT